MIGWIITEESKPVAASADSVPVDASRLLLKVGQITDIKKHPDADTLYVETVNLAEDKPRTIVSGLVKHVPIEQVLWSILDALYLTFWFDLSNYFHKEHPSAPYRCLS